MTTSIHPETRPGPVTLRVADLGTEAAFYEQTVGLELSDSSSNRAVLGAGAEPLVVLDAVPGAPPRPRGTSGLFHLAIVVPDRVELARSLARIAEERWPLAGASDHLVSEALYLSDPEGNGIEIYRDRPKERWPHEDGELRMATLPLDLDSVMSELGGAEEGSNGAAPGTRIGHVHLNVSDLGEAEDFYADTLGLDVTVRGYPGALFLSAGGYHHHVGVNTWQSEGGPPPPAGSRGLESFALLVPDDELAGLRDQLRRAGAPVEETPDGIATEDPSGNALVLAAA
jgi:catechol 2,3-dioxygenase